MRGGPVSRFAISVPTVLEGAIARRAPVTPAARSHGQVSLQERPHDRQRDPLVVVAAARRGAPAPTSVAGRARQAL